MSAPAFDVVVVGAGPAGLAAAACAAESGRRVALIDDNPDTGGQIWRNVRVGPAERWRGRVRRAGVTVLSGVSVVQRDPDGSLLAQAPDRQFTITAGRIVLAVGARELFLPFPGWTLPNVTGVGGLQSLVKTGWDLRGKRIVIAGSGPLLLAVASYLKRHGSHVLGIAEQAPPHAVRRFALGLVRHPAKLVQAISLRTSLLDVPYWTGHWPLSAEGDGVLQAVTITDGPRPRRLECDVLACAFGLVPNLHLPAALGCEITKGFVRADEFQQTSVPDISCAGEPTGIGGIEVALVEGQIAGYAAAGQTDRARAFVAQRSHAQRFAVSLNRAFGLREEVRRLAAPETIVCRCEDVPLARIRACDSWRDAKLQTRCGMGPCQGRVCGPAVTNLTGWDVSDARPPILPTTVAALGGLSGPSVLAPPSPAAPRTPAP